ncbi:hypothetical protein FHX44_116407 [Pseudonocardia hierapolitana]|uniref:Uncharacterized protein n=1 Tax=Pseudonocardia hierapolitana TaxID=1128676 RepID=A0A561T031_9PSEU|nr:hypothetical protein FHX44_116407 [Pseudonocardia hierapolitana]
MGQKGMQIDPLDGLHALLVGFEPSLTDVRFRRSESELDRRL